MPEVDYSDSPQWLQLVIGALALLALVAAVYGFAHKLWPVVRKFVRTIEALDDLPETLDGMKKFRIDTAQSLAAQDDQIADIHHEVHYNNGSSVKDAINRLEVGQTSAKESLDRIPEIEKGVAGLYERVNENEADAAKDRKDIAATRDELERTKPTIRKPRSKP